MEHNFLSCRRPRGLGERGCTCSWSAGPYLDSDEFTAGASTPGPARAVLARASLSHLALRRRRRWCFSQHWQHLLARTTRRHSCTHALAGAHIGGGAWAEWSPSAAWPHNPHRLFGQPADFGGGGLRPTVSRDGCGGPHVAIAARQTEGHGLVRVLTRSRQLPIGRWRGVRLRAGRRLRTACRVENDPRGKRSRRPASPF